MKRKGIWIDSNLTGRGLSPLDKLLYSQIVYYSKDAGFCMKSNPELAIELEVSGSSVKRSLEILEEKGLINRDTDRKIGNVRKLIPSVQNDPTPTVKMTLPSVQNDPTPTVKMTLPSVQNDPTYIGRITKEQLNKQSINNSNNGFQKVENLATAEKIEIIDFVEKGGLKEIEKKAPQAGGGGGRKLKPIDTTPEILFSESDLYDYEIFEEYMLEKYPEANPNYYYVQIRDWQNPDGSHPRRKNWRLVIKTFVTGDYAKGRLITKNHVGYEKSKQQSNQEQFTDPYSLVNQYLNSL
jgi:hypothetical protein